MLDRINKNQVELEDPMMFCCLLPPVFMTAAVAAAQAKRGDTQLANIAVEAKQASKLHK